jgi:hypothetical protein
MDCIWARISWHAHMHVYIASQLAIVDPVQKYSSSLLFDSASARRAQLL